MERIVLSLLCFQTASAVTHSLKYFYSASSGVPTFPEFVVVSMVDDSQTVYYDSNTQKAVPKQEWMEKTTKDLPNYWERESGKFLGAQQSFKANIDIAKQRFNQTGGVHTFQLMYGCELNDDGSTLGDFQYGYDGEDFLSLDKSTRTWTAANQKAVITKLKWDATGAEANFQKNYLENTCIEWLQKYVNYGKSVLERKAPPSVSLFQKTLSSPVACHATDFYPDKVMMFWRRDGEDHHEDVEVGETLPNPDGTFQIRSTLSVSADEMEKHEYTCVVQHSSDNQDIIMSQRNMRKPGSNESTGIIVAVVVVGLLVLAICVAGFFIFKKKRNEGFKPANTSETASDNSSNPPA